MDKNLPKRMKFSISLFIVSMLFCLYSYGQTNRVSGTVVSAEDSKPLPGVSVKVKGAKTGTVSAVDGTYSIMAKPTDILVFTFLSYTTQQIDVGSKVSIDVKMKESISNLNEVVVIGYAKVARKDLTGSISSISGNELRKTQPTTFDQALQGKVPGLVIQQVSGQPGGGVSIQIRGVSSISGSNSPLFVI